MTQVRGWLSVKQAAAELGVTTEAVYQLVKARRLEDWSAGDVRLIRRGDLDQHKAAMDGKQRPGPRQAVATTTSAVTSSTPRSSV
jgi:excisionase family DNA binding protein